MNEFVHILSNDLILIKQMIDYSLISTKFTLKGISTGGNLNVKEILDENISILIIDENSLNELLLARLKQQIKDTKLNEIAVIYICSTITPEVKMFLQGFNTYKLLSKRGTFFDVLYLLEKLCDEHQNVESARDKMIVDHLHILYIKPKVFGFTYLKAAISLRIDDSQMKMNTICDKIAREYHVTSSRVDRCMRTSIENAYQLHSEIYESLYDFEERPTCMNLISRIAEEIEQIS